MTESPPDVWGLLLQVRDYMRQNFGSGAWAGELIKDIDAALVQRDNYFLTSKKEAGTEIDELQRKLDDSQLIVRLFEALFRRLPQNLFDDLLLTVFDPNDTNIQKLKGLLSSKPAADPRVDQ
jgi:hypothetical protein